MWYPEKIDSKFRYVLIAASRAEQLMKGARAKVDEPGRKISRIAMQEVRDDLVAWEYGPAPEPEPEPDEEVEEAAS